MKYIKMLSLVALAAVAAMALAGTASATTLTSPEGTTYTGELKAEAIGSGLLFHGTGTYGCNDSQAEGKVEQHGSGVTVLGKLTKWTLEGCNNHVTVLKLGTITIHTEKESANGNGLVTVSGTEVTTTTTSIGMSCLYTTNETELGVLTGSNETGGNARLVIDSALIPRTGHSVFCGTGNELTGEYEITTPSKLYID